MTGDVLECREIAWMEPLAAFDRWQGLPGLAFLDSAGTLHERARWAILAADPFRILSGRAEALLVDGAPVDGDPFAVLGRELARFRLAPGSAPVPFAGGAIGFFGYELAAPLEKLRPRHPDRFGLDDWWLGFYDAVLAFDRAERRAWILSSGFPQDGPARQARAARRADEIQERLAAPAPPPRPALPPIDWRCELPRGEYERRVAEVIEHIRAGDIYQANFTGRHLAARPAGLDPAALWLALRRASPAPFAAYLAPGADYVLAGASPERFIRLGPDGRIETRPIKGTRPRGATPAEDMALRRELAESAKDRAENLMIVDLLRNDIGRVAEIGSVAVEALCELESFASVHHLVSSVTGRLRPGLGPADLLCATLPGGSITGAPKIRAMQIIDALEVARRGPYCGAVAWIGFDGAMDSSITIRTITVTRDTLIAQAGGGIVADSDPEAEFEEMMVKVRPLLLGGG
ncbi:MAG TPA: aminodeoxychorismate synthase component I [Stellaceae bacterium]|nr:aminodeoxychorismate synthase component I [Stellaceae bacterium]